MSPRWWRRSRWLLAAAVVVVTAVAGQRFLAEPEPTGEWVRVERRPLVLEVDMSGELEAVRSDDYGPPALSDVWEFKISFLAPEGAEVEAGAPVLGFDASQLEQRLLNAVADRDSAQKTLEKRQQDLELERRQARLLLAEAQAGLRKNRLKTDVPAEVVARRELRTARIDEALAAEELSYREAVIALLDRQTAAELEALRAEWARTRARVAEIESAIARMTVKAVRAGTILFHTNWQGEKKKIGDRCWRDELVLKIPDLREMRAVVEVDEAKAGRLSVGQPASFRLDAHLDRAYRASVEKIQRTVQRRSWRDPRKVVRLELALDETDAARMRPGMRLQGTIEVERLDDVLTLPLDAVVPARDGARVRVRSTFGEDWRRPELGRRNQQWVEVVSGLDAGSEVWHYGTT